MYPYITILGHETSSYSLMAIIGCMVSFAFVLLRCLKKKLRLDDQLYFIVFIFFSAFFGAKILYLILNIPEIWKYREIIFSSFSMLGGYLAGGYVFYGGLLGGLAGAVCYAKFFRVNAVKMAENFVPGIPLFHCFGRIGCFLAGCCYGVEYDGVGAVIYEKSDFAPNGISIFPVQLLEAAVNVVFGVILLIVEKKSKKPLQNFGLYLLMYGISRFFIEFLRGDDARGFWGMLSVSQ